MRTAALLIKREPWRYMKTWSKAWSTATFPRKNTAASNQKKVNAFIRNGYIDLDLNEFCDKKFKADYLTY